MKILALMGKSACGKDRIAKTICEIYKYKYIVSTTSRKRREKEVNGVNYNFVSEKEFKEMIRDNKMIEYTLRNVDENTTLYYGITLDSIDVNSDNNYICVVDLVGVQRLKEEFGDKVTSIYIKVDDAKRKERAFKERINGLDELEWESRLKDDNYKLFNVEKFADYVVYNNNNITNTMYEIDKIIGIK